MRNDTFLEDSYVGLMKLLWFAFITQTSEKVVESPHCLPASVQYSFPAPASSAVTSEIRFVIPLIH